MRPLLIDENARAKIAQVIAYAQANRLPRFQMMALMRGQKKPIGNTPGHCCELEVGFRVVYSIEEQPFGWSHHISVSISDPDKLPSVPAVQLIAKEFGITQKIGDPNTHLYIEDECSPKAINFIAKIESGPS